MTEKWDAVNLHLNERKIIWGNSSHKILFLKRFSMFPLKAWEHWRKTGAIWERDKLYFTKLLIVKQLCIRKIFATKNMYFMLTSIWFIRACIATMYSHNYLQMISSHMTPMMSPRLAVSFLNLKIKILSFRPTMAGTWLKKKNTVYFYCCIQKLVVEIFEGKTFSLKASPP